MARVVAIVQDAYASNIARMGQPPVPTLDDCARWLAAAQLWGIKVQGCVKGALVLEDGTDALLIDDIAIDPTAQNTGLATACLVFAEAEASLRALLTLRLYNNASMIENLALCLYRGFAITHRATEYGYDRVHMAKSVA